jgi:methionyl-tRNA formyltransferase
MKIVFWGKGLRSYYCLKKLVELKYDIALVVGQDNDKRDECSVLSLADKYNLKSINPANPNDVEIENLLKTFKADLFVLGGYGYIVKQNIIDIAKIMTINLHGGKLPDARGSSPLNWALINGKDSVTLSIIQVDSGVDTGPVILDRSFDVKINDTIVDLHKIANQAFPEMLIEVVEQIKNNTYTLREQKRNIGDYYPLRFPEDGFILFDQLTAKQIHNRIRALTEPYPCAFTYYNGEKVKLIASEHNEIPFYGEAGRVYMKTKRGLLVCGKDKCLWIKKGVFVTSGNDIWHDVNRYDKFATAKGAILESFES